MERIPDHPAIRRAEETGYPYGHDPRKYTTCDWCGGDIHYGDRFYNIHGEILCEACVEDCEEEATDD